MDAFPFGAFVVASVASLFAALVTWLIGNRIGRYNVIDVAWGVGFVLVAAVTFVLSGDHGDATRRLIVLAVVAVWGLRLATFIGWRSRGHGEDRRYTEMLAKADGDPAIYALTHVFLTQAVALWFISLPVQVAMFETSTINSFVWIGVVIAVIGIGFESIGDAQLLRFTRDPANHDQVMDRGLWHYTRHPNYFGDACVWWGLFVIAAASWPGVLTVLSPLGMTWLLASKTGKPLLERDIASRRPGYADYVDRTSGFVPWFPRPDRGAVGT
jgi:steroid 5-alpha reductase family enzyme